MFDNLPESLISSFNLSQIGEWLSIIKIVFMLLALLLVFFLIFLLLKSSWIRFILLYDVVEFFTYKPFGAKKIEKDWSKITSRLDTGLESEYKLALIEADNMINEILKRMDYKGESLGERLENLTTAAISNVEEVKQAHQIRNNIIHDPNYKLSLEETKRVLAIFEKVLKDLETF